MAQYADLVFYQVDYYGDVLPLEFADKWLARASGELDRLTFERLSNAFPTVEAHAVKVKEAVCEIAEMLYGIDNARKSGMLNRTEDGSFRGPVASVSSGRESISYVQGADYSAYTKAATDIRYLNQLISETATRYLSNIPDSNGINLLYAGRG